MAEIQKVMPDVGLGNGVHVKPWGLSTTICCDGLIQVARCDIAEGGYSSVHVHERKDNRFIVHQGTVIVRKFYVIREEVKSLSLNSGDSLLVPAGIPHQFFATCDTVLTETYNCPDGSLVRWNDIMRFTQNGIGSLDDLQLPADLWNRIRQWRNG
jgi:mannose-6-phosphate isomerase-like protein (cupin superfamily)